MCLAFACRVALATNKFGKLAASKGDAEAGEDVDEGAAAPIAAPAPAPASFAKAAASAGLAAAGDRCCCPVAVLV